MTKVRQTVHMATAISVQRSVPKSVDEVRSALGTGGRRELAVPAALSAFVRGPLVVNDVRTWNGDSADVVITVEGQPVRIAGTIGLRPASDACDVDVALAVTADVPFVGSMVESAIAPEVTALINRELDKLVG